MENWSDVVMGADRWFPDNRSPPIFKGGTLEMKKTGTKAVKIFKRYMVEYIGKALLVDSLILL